ncbi:MAG: metallophosphoesterase family protein, partial [Patescibacteria group bacterium]
PLRHNDRRIRRQPLKWYSKKSQHMKKKKILWLTDIHLNFLTNEALDFFIKKIQNKSPDILLIGGDIGEAKSVCSYLQKLDELGDKAAAKIETSLISAFKNFKKVICLTHVPPFREACWHEGKISDDNYIPHFSCKTVGEIMKKIMQSRPDCHLTVLCGHTHSPGAAKILDNLTAITGEAFYGKPEIQKIIYL